ncbi:hypothetical protein JCM10450v2_007540 [Rhodotorula kratochvilovae]
MRPLAPLTKPKLTLCLVGRLPSMYGVGSDFAYDAGDPVSPIGPDLQQQDDWWFRGPEYRALKPQDGAVTDLPAGGSIDVEIACNVAWTSYGISPTDPDEDLSACPDNYGAHHAGDPDGPIDDSLVSGCALAIADKDDIEQVGWDDLVVFSVNHNCVRKKVNTFEVPERMPACSGDKCICAWLWLANNGTANFYMTGFDCRITDVDDSLARPLLPPVDPVFCPVGDTTCEPAAGAKSAYNQPTNVKEWDNERRPGYHADWSFPINGAQDDIFDLSGAANTTSSIAPPVSASTGVSSTIRATAVATTSSPSASASTTTTRSRTSTGATTDSATSTTDSMYTSTRTRKPRISASTVLSSSLLPSNASTTPSLAPSSGIAPSRRPWASLIKPTPSAESLSSSITSDSTTSTSSRRHSPTGRPSHDSPWHHHHDNPIGEIVEEVGDVLDGLRASVALDGYSVNVELGSAAKLSLRQLERRGVTSGGARIASMASLAGFFVFTFALVALH